MTDRPKILAKIVTKLPGGDFKIKPADKSVTCEDILEALNKTGDIGDAVTERAEYPTYRTLRDEFAMSALVIFSHAKSPTPLTADELPKLAYEFADMMMEARKS